MNDGIEFILLKFNLTSHIIVVMRTKKLDKQIKSLENLCEIFLEKNDDEDHKDEEQNNENLILKIQAFNNIVKECKEEVASSDIDHKKHVLKLLYNVDIELNIDLDDYISNQETMSVIEQNEQYVKNLKDIESNVDDIIEKLTIEYENMVHLNKSWYRFKGLKLKQYAKFLARLMDLKEKINKKLKSYSKNIAFQIIENFYSIYILFSFLISILISTNREFLLIEILGRIDRYIDLIEPAFKHRALHQNDMMYHYTIYELDDLRNKIIKELALL